MSSVPARELRKALLKKGFVEQTTHHRLFFLHVEGKQTPIYTRLSHGIPEYGDNLLAQVARQMRITRRQLDEFVRCPLDYTGYVQTLRATGALQQPGLPSQ